MPRDKELKLDTDRAQYGLLSAGFFLVVICGFGVGCRERTTPNGSAISSMSRAPEENADAITTRTDTSRVNETTGNVEERPSSVIQFENVVSSSGITDVVVSGAERQLAGMIETIGGGISLIDYDLDGLCDIALPGGADRPGNGDVVGLQGGLHRATSAFRFDSVGISACFDLSEFASQDVAVGDIDSDGFGDAFVSGYGGVQCFMNQGDGTFAKLSPSSGLKADLWNSASVIADLNGDTLPDLYVARYLDWSETNDPRCYPRAATRTPALFDPSKNASKGSCNPRRFLAYDDLLFFSNGDGTFTEVGTVAGVATGGRGLAVLAADLDDDRDLEIYVANDSDQNFLYRNNSDGTLSEIAVRAGVATDKDGISQGSMGISIGDINGDKRPDLFVSNFMEQLPAIYISRGRLNYRFNTSERGINLLGAKHVSWGTTMMDFDNDGDEDIVVVSGDVDMDETRDAYLQTPSLLENLGDGLLRDNSRIAGGFFLERHPARGLATTDFDGDGKVDFVTSNLNLPIGILKNRGESTNHWLQINAIGVKSARLPVGTSIELQSGERCWVRQVVAGGSFSSSSDPTVHIGVGKDASLPATLTLRWPSGGADELQVDRWDEKLTIIESDR